MPLRSSLLSLLLLPATLSAQIDRARDLVDPFVGTGGHGHTFPGACVPNGLVQLSPDTRTDGYMDWDACGGYHHSDSIIHGFSHTHLSGTGVPDLCDVLVMPFSKKYATNGMIFPRSSHFSHATETANAGFYSVYLDEVRVKAELTSTARVGVHRYTFEPGTDGWLKIDLRHRDKLIHASLRAGGNGELVGERRSSSWANDQRLFFCIRFSRPPVDMNTGVSGQDTTNVLLRFGVSASPLIVKVGISAVSIEGARKNLEAEVPGWDFDAVRKQAEDAWNTKLAKIEVEGGTREQQRTFYTALYHCYVAPYVFNDVDGNYRGMDGAVHHADHDVYTVFSLWDTFRALHPLMTILEPDMTNDLIRTFLLHYQQGGRLPVWELWGNETDCMIGYHSVSVIADAYIKGIRGFDAELALKAMMAGAMRDEPGLNAYRTKGFISSEDAPESVSKTLEYAYDDGCIARFATSIAAATFPLDRRDALQVLCDSAAFILAQRAGNWQNLYDPATGFFRARYNGGFKEPFDPYEVNFNFTEANAWQYGLFAPQALDQLIGEHGGNAAFEAQLDKLFAASHTTSGRDQADITGLIGQYAQGNEPSHNVAYLYDRVGRPDKTRALVKRIMDDFYHDAPDGLIGNEDCGQMSAWYVMSALGLYQVAPGIDPRYDLGYPLFGKATIHLPNGKTWAMVVDPHVTGADPREFRLEHTALLEGGQLVFDTERRPVLGAHAAATALEGAYIRTDGRPGAPIIQAPSAAFRDPMQVTVIGKGTCTVSDSSGTRSCPVGAPFTLERTSTVQVAWNKDLAPVVAHFTRADGSRSIRLESRFANQYAAGGDQALVDGLRGGNDFRTGEWQGFHDTDVVATIDLGRIKKLQRAGLSVFQDQGAWIWYPSSVTIAWSMDKHHWSSATVLSTVARDVQGAMHQELWTKPIGKRARYVKVIARNAGPCPDWHPGKGGATWIFTDEVLIEAE